MKTLIVYYSRPAARDEFAVENNGVLSCYDVIYAKSDTVDGIRVETMPHD